MRELYPRMELVRPRVPAKLNPDGSQTRCFLQPLRSVLWPERGQNGHLVPVTCTNTSLSYPVPLDLERGLKGIGCASVQTCLISVSAVSGLCSSTQSSCITSLFPLRFISVDCLRCNAGLTNHFTARRAAVQLSSPLGWCRPLLSPLVPADRFELL